VQAGKSSITKDASILQRSLGPNPLESTGRIPQYLD